MSSEALPLFDQMQQPAAMPTQAPDPMQQRREAMDAAFAHADERFRDEYERMVRRFAARGVEFTGEDVRAAYKAATHLPQPREWRATGGIYQRLIRRKVIVAVGYRKRDQGNPTPVYRGAGL